MTHNKYDFALLSVLEAERKALGSVLSERISNRFYHPTLGEVLHLSMPHRKEAKTRNGLIVSIPSAGRVEGALTAAAVLATWLPKCVILVGVAGGFRARGVGLGDILVSTEIVDYAIQKVTSEFIIRQQRFSISKLLLEIAHKIPLNSDMYEFQYERRRLNSRVHFGPIASGDVIVSSSHLVSGLLEIDAALLGVEMEAGGVAAAVRRASPQIELIAIRGVADLADESKNDLWVDRACYAAAQFTSDLLCRL